MSGFECTGELGLTGKAIVCTCVCVLCVYVDQNNVCFVRISVCMICEQTQQFYSEFSYDGMTNHHGYSPDYPQARQRPTPAYMTLADPEWPIGQRALGGCGGMYY
jgi:hypothetical protein